MSSRENASGETLSRPAIVTRVAQDEALQGTPVRETIRRPPTSEDAQFSVLPTLKLKNATPTMFAVADTRLGAGGGGEVLLARQPALRRDVAIKVPRASEKTDTTERVLLREALVMGYLEHPNIVPIHVLARDEDGTVLVVMKRIEGQTLESIIETGSRSLDQMLGVLMAVCNALDFAHKRGIVHLDLKPANIMVGPHGETYLLDWGIAVAFRDDVPDTIPRAANDGKVHGTPAYLPPEMVMNIPPNPMSDVYLAGGVLHEILTGAPPNAGDNAEEALVAACEAANRAYPPDAPSALVEIAERALSQRPTHRYTSIGAFKAAVEEYRRNVAGRDLHESAQDQLEVFEQAIEAEADRLEVYSAFGAARQLLIDASSRYEDPSLVDEDEDALLRRMIAWEAETGDPVAALRLSHELRTEAPELRAKVEAAVEAAEAEMVELRELKRQMNPRVANRAKIRLFAAVGTVIAVIHLVPFALDVESTVPQVLGGHVAYLVALGVITYAARERAMATYANRQVVNLIWLLSLFGLVLRSSALLGAISLGHAIALDLALVGFVAAFGTVMIDRRVWPAPPWYAVFTIACFALPEYGTVWFGLGHFVALMSIAISFALTVETDAAGPAVAIERSSG